jgi:hypothetical protein
MTLIHRFDFAILPAAGLAGFHNKDPDFDQGESADFVG